MVISTGGNGVKDGKLLTKPAYSVLDSGSSYFDDNMNCGGSFCGPILSLYGLFKFKTDVSCVWM